jgi:hypothetical protein
MSISTSSDCKLLLYADDSTFSHRNPDVISEKLGKELQFCSQWLIDNKLSLHLGKTECILFGSKRKLKKADKFQVIGTCNEHIITAQSSVKYLGINIGKFLSGEIIINNIIKKVNSRLKFLYRQGRSLSENARKTLTTALIQCHFDNMLIMVCWFVQKIQR